MAHASAQVDAADSLQFVPLGQYNVPSLPTEHALRRYWVRLKDALVKEETLPFFTDDQLSAVTQGLQEEQASPGLCAPLIDALEATLGPWVSQQRPDIKLVVLPPCDPSDILRHWAQQQGHFIVQPPSRQQLFSDEVDFPPRCDPGALLVIPRLESWFLRHQHGLRALRTLLARLESLRQPCVIGCNSWAWAYLCVATGAATILPPAIVPPAFDARRLHRWFSLLVAESGAPISFRLAANGADILATDEQGEPEDSYLTQLAFASQGIPWVARLMWRESLRSHGDLGELPERVRQSMADDDKTLWVAPWADPKMPAQARANALLVLQSLLIHGGLKADELLLTLPSNCDLDVLPALVDSRFVERRDGLTQVRASAYPQARQLLVTAGYPEDRL